jgi:hypothetical protein
MRNLYIFPDDWEQPPRAYRLLPDWEERAITNSNEIKFLDFRWEYITVPWDRFLLLHTHNGEVTSVGQSIEFDGVIYELQPDSGDQSEKLQPNFLYKYLITD